MHRRRFLQTGGITAVSIAVAGCPATGDDAPANRNIDGPDDADAMVVVTRNAPQNQAPFEDSVEDLPPQESDAMTVGGVIFQRAGERGLVVAGDLTNTAEDPFELVNVEVVLYDRSDVGAVLDSTGRQTVHGELDPGSTWQWATLFREEPDFEIDYFTVQALASFA